MMLGWLAFVSGMSPGPTIPKGLLCNNPMMLSKDGSLTFSSLTDLSVKQDVSSSIDSDEAS